MHNVFKAKKRLVAGSLAVVLAFSAVGTNTLTVSAANPKAVKSVTVKIGKKSVTKKTYTLNQNKSVTLKVSVAPKAAKKSVSFKTSKKSIATVTKKGKVTAKKGGTAKITVTVTGKNNKKKSTWVKIKVPKTTNNTTQAPTTQAPVQVVKLAAINIKADATEIYEAGGQTQLTVTSATPGASIASVSYESTNTQTATVDANGKVTGVNPGQVSINVVAKDKYNNEVKDSIIINVKEKSQITLSLDKTKVSLTEGEETVLTASYSGATESDSLTWESFNTDVVKVEKTGTNKAKLVAVGEGTAKVEVRVGTVVANCEVTVTKASSTVSLLSAAATHYNVVKATFDKAVSAENQKKITFKLTDGNGNERSISETVWSEDGKSVELHNKDEYIASKYTLVISGDEANINPSGNKKEFIIAERQVKKVEFVNKYLPLAIDENGKTMEDGKIVKLNFKVIDQYGDQIEKQKASDYTFQFSATGLFSLSEDMILKDTDSVYFTIPAIAEAGDKLTVKIYDKDDATTALGSATIELQKLDINRIEILGVDQEEEVYQSDEDIDIPLKCNIYDSYGQLVDLADANFNQITVLFKSSNAEVCTFTGFTANRDKVVVTVKADKYTETGKPVQLTAINDAKYDNSVYDLNVKKKTFPAKMVLGSKESSVISQDQDLAKIPVQFIDQYGSEMPVDVVTIATVKQYFNINVSSTNAEEWTNNALNIVTENGVQYLTISGQSLNKTNDDKDAYYNVSFAHKDAAYSDNTAAVKVTLQTARKASKVVIKEEPKLSLYDNETTTFAYEIQDQYGKEWTGDAELDIIADDTNSVTATELADKKVKITAKKQSNVGKGTLSFGILGNDEANYVKRTFEVKENFAKLLVTFVDRKDEYVAGEDVTLQIQAVDKDNKVLTAYNEEVTTPFNTTQNGVDNIPQSGMKFVNGVATITVKASKAEEAVYYSFTVALPGKAATEYRTSDIDAVKVVPGEVAKYQVSYTDGVITVVAQDGEGNTVEKFNNESVILSVTSDGEILVRKAYTFTAGKATITDCTVEAGETITVTDPTGTITGSCKVK